MIRNMARLKGIDEILDIDSILPAPADVAQPPMQMPPQGAPMPNAVDVQNDHVAQGIIDSETPQQVNAAYEQANAVL
jgi:hypothetical protein